MTNEKPICLTLVVALLSVQHDDRDAPPGHQRRSLHQSSRGMRRWSPPAERQGRNRDRERGPRFKRHSSDERVWRRDRNRDRERDRYGKCESRVQ